MCFSRVALLLVSSCACCLCFAQAPVLIEPQAFAFQNYAQGPLVTSGENNAGSTWSSEDPYGYTPPHTKVSNASTQIIDAHKMPLNPTPRQQVSYADEQIRLHELSKKQNLALLDKANTELEHVRIEYELPFVNAPAKNVYASAFNEIEAMLNGKDAIDLERAVFLVEKAFDPSLDYKDFDSQIAKSVVVIGQKMAADKLSASDNLAKIMTAFRFMTDTISVSSKGESTITTYPKTYDFEDFWGRQDYRKMFVSKLLKEGSGQCHSLPLLFLLLCEKMDAKAHLAFAPNHSFIKFQDKKGKWHNLELTNGMLASDNFIIQSGYVKAEAIQNKIYMEPLTKKQVIVQCLNDLAQGYQKKFGYDPFVKHCAEIALLHDPKSLTAHQTRANYYITLTNYVAHQYKAKKLTKSQFDQDQQAQDLVATTDRCVRDIENLGYADMPADAYEAWLTSIQKEVNKQRHHNEVKVLGGMIEIKK